MTIQLGYFTAKLYGASKAKLQAALNLYPSEVAFEDPGIKPETKHGSAFYGSELDPGEWITVVLDPETRMRFARVGRRVDRTFKVQ